MNSSLQIPLLTSSFFLRFDLLKSAAVCWSLRCGSHCHPGLFFLRIWLAEERCSAFANLPPLHLRSGFPLRYWTPLNPSPLMICQSPPTMSIAPFWGVKGITAKVYWSNAMNQCLSLSFWQYPAGANTIPVSYFWAGTSDDRPICQQLARLPTLQPQKFRSQESAQDLLQQLGLDQPSRSSLDSCLNIQWSNSWNVGPEEAGDSRKRILFQWYLQLTVSYIFYII